VLEKETYLKNLDAKKYLRYGIGRRLKIIKHCIQNIFQIFPPERKNILEDSEQQNITINLQAFLVNIFGVLDNMAWVIIREKGINIQNNSNVNLFKKDVKKVLDDNIEKEKVFKDYLSSDKTKNWHDTYLKNYRDSLSHRIPLYVPPKAMTKEQAEKESFLEIEKRKAILNFDFEKSDELEKKIDSIGFPAPVFSHSITECIVLHFQLITDFKTIEETLNKFCDIFTDRKKTYRLPSS